MAGKRDYYEVIGVTKDTSSDDIRKAYHKLAMKYHPDRNPDDPEAEAKFKEAAEAYEVLGDGEKRSRYDQYGHAGLSGTAFHDFTSADDIFDAFGDIFGGGFSELFGNRGRKRGPRRGRHLRIRLELDLSEAAKGVKRSFDVRREENCEDCGGSGAQKGSAPVTCQYCGGRGETHTTQGFFRIATTCRSCQGTGKMIRDPCAGCDGSGRMMASRTIEVEIPAGVDNGTQVRVRGEGDAGDSGAHRGDLHCVISVRDHPLFHRDGPNLICRVPITFSQATLGGDIEVPTLDGKQSITIPSGTQSGELIRLRGLGMPSLQHRGAGDLVVQVFIETPKKLTKRQEELLREFAALEQSNVTPQRRSFFETLKEYLVSSEEKS